MSSAPAATGLSTFNISTTAAILCAAAGVTVAKHGNRAVTSSVGSADVIEELGIRIDLSPADAARALREHGFAFFFAPNFHPAFKHIAPARKLCAERGQRTIFNFLGPLLNPARPSAMLVGVPRPELCEPMARALQSLGVRRGMVVCGIRSGAESNSGRTFHARRKHDRGILSGTRFCGFEFVAGKFSVATGDAGGFARRRQNGECGNHPPHFPRRRTRPQTRRGSAQRAAALFVAGKTKSLAEGWDLAGRDH